MTETMTTTSETENRPRCGARRATGEECWREATEQMWELAPEPFSVCAEHKNAFELGQEVDEHLLALDRIQEWITTTVKDADDDRLRTCADLMRQRAELEYWPAAVAAKAADIIANQREGEKPLTEHQARYLATVWLRSDALIDALVVLEDAPAELFGTRDRWTIVAALQKVVEFASEEFRLYKEEIGIK
jgi:hypothetical protein